MNFTVIESLKPVQIKRETFLSKELSLEAKGFYAFILCLNQNDSEEFGLVEISSCLSISEERILELLKELQKLNLVDKTLSFVSDW